jgi:Rab-like protein 2
MCLLFLFE